ncbi:MAG TPA: Bax inhibitor-1 family protein, partial [bacterium]|nr:Bax inhibitor-1 family protein [bacterium]
MADNRSPWADFRTTPATRARAVEVGGIHARFMSQVYAWMTFGIVLTGFVSYATAQTPELVIRLVSNPLLFWGLIIAQFGAVIFLTAAINKVSALTATLVFLAYAGLT